MPSCLLWRPSLADHRMASLIFIAGVLQEKERKKGEREKNPTLFLPLHVSPSPLTVTLLDFGNLRPGVKMAASGESAHPG